jgi:hypothetical protein
MNHRKLSIQKNILGVLVFTLSLLSLLLVFSPAELAQAAGVDKTVITVDFPDFGCDPNTTICQTFKATGGVVCDHGTAVDTPIDYKFNDPPQPNLFHLYKTFTCADDSDGSNTFTIQVEAKALPGAPTDSGGFRVKGGTGDYEDLHGGGSLVGDRTTYPNGIIDVYTGILMN